MFGRAPILEMLLAAPGVDPLARTSVRAVSAQGACAYRTRTPLLQEGKTPRDVALLHEHAAAAAKLPKGADAGVAASLAAATPADRPSGPGLLGRLFGGSRR